MKNPLKKENPSYLQALQGWGTVKGTCDNCHGFRGTRGGLQAQSGFLQRPFHSHSLSCSTKQQIKPAPPAHPVHGSCRAHSLDVDLLLSRHPQQKFEVGNFQGSFVPCKLQLKHSKSAACAMHRSCAARSFDVACACRVITTAVAINERQDTAVPKMMKVDTIMSRFQLLYRP